MANKYFPTPKTYVELRMFLKIRVHLEVKVFTLSLRTLLKGKYGIGKKKYHMLIKHQSYDYVLLSPIDTGNVI